MNSNNILIALIIALFVNTAPGLAKTGIDATHHDSLKIIVLGSSTAAGTGPLNKDNAWVNRYRDFILTSWPNSQVINLAKGGYKTYHIMPDEFIPHALRPLRDTQRNITKAISYNPTAIIINLPSNDAASGYSLSEQLANYDSILAITSKRNIPVWISTTQPRNLESQQWQNLTAMRDSTFSRFRAKTMDFWYGLAGDHQKILPEYDCGDGIHLNDDGHQILLDRALISGAGLPAYDMQLTHPQSGKKYAGNIEITWSPEIKSDTTRTTTIAVSANGGKNWITIATIPNNEASFTWNTETYANGLFYTIRVVALGVSGYARVQLQEPFILNNP